MKKQIQLILLVGMINLYGFEVNTHQAITRCAINENISQCKTEGTKNLEAFMKHVEISKNDIYKNQYFDKYKFQGKDVKYIKYIAEAENAIKDYNVPVTGTYKGMIEAGVILEDAVYPHADFGGDGRFNNHFYSAQFKSKDYCEAKFEDDDKDDYVTDMLSDRALCVGYGVRTDNISWALQNGVNLGRGRTNDYGLHDAFDYFGKSFIGSVANREKYQAKLFVSIGFMIHLIQDLHSPAHCRDGSHPAGDYLEIYGRYDNAFNLRAGSMNPKNNHDIERAITNFDMKQVMLKDNKYVSYQDFFQKEALWVSSNFMSEAHINFLDKPDKETGSGLKYNNLLDTDTIFDGRNARPNEGGDTYNIAIPNFDGGEYIVSTGNTIRNSIRGQLDPNHKVVAMVDTKSALGLGNEHMISPKWKYSNGKAVITGVDQTPLVDTAINVMPRAVASTQAFINFFFRGQMEASLSADHTKLVIKNVSVKEGRVHHAKLLTFKRGGKFTLYVDKGGVSTAIQTVTLASDMKMNETRSMNISNHNLAVGTKVTVVYDGKIGDDMGGYNQYGIGMRGMRGMSADVFIVQEKPKECSDTSLMATIGLVKNRLLNRSNCVGFPDIEFDKIIWVDEGARCRLPITYFNAQLLGRGHSSDKTIDGEELINYFNKNIYKLPEPKKEVVEVKVYSSYEADRYDSNDELFVGYVVKIYKNGILTENINLQEFLKFKKFSGAAHVGKPHYDVWCNGSIEICSYLKPRVASDSSDQLEYYGLDWVANANSYDYMVGKVSRQLENYYAKTTSQKDYPQDWLKRIVDWIEEYDCTKAKKANIFYDEGRVENTIELKGL